MEKTVKIHTANYTQISTYLLALLFITGNLLLPRLCHFLPWGGAVLLPIYFFTLIGAYKYGIWVGLLTAVASPLLNNLLFGMPGAAVLPVILIKSVLLAIAAAMAARQAGKISLFALLGVVLFYQVAGTAAEWIVMGDFRVAVQDFRMGIAGMIIQVVGGYFLLRAIARL